jgi:hypothetical protein
MWQNGQALLDLNNSEILSIPTSSTWKAVKFSEVRTSTHPSGKMDLLLILFECILIIFSSHFFFKKEKKKRKEEEVKNS